MTAVGVRRAKAALSSGCKPHPAIATQLLDLSVEVAKRGRRLSAAQMQRLFDFVEAHLNQPLTIEALEREAGASSSHLRHCFKALTRMTVHRYVMQRRVERARLLLLRGTMSASEIALATGFSHQSHMARAGCDGSWDIRPAIYYECMWEAEHPGSGSHRRVYGRPVRTCVARRGGRFASGAPVQIADTYAVDGA